MRQAADSRREAGYLLVECCKDAHWCSSAIRWLAIEHLECRCVVDEAYGRHVDPLRLVQCLLVEEYMQIEVRL